MLGAYIGRVAGRRAEAPNRIAKTFLFRHAENFTMLPPDREQRATEACRATRPWKAGTELSSFMVMMTVVVMMVARGKSRTCEHHREERGGNQFLHEKKSSTNLQARE